MTPYKYARDQNLCTKMVKCPSRSHVAGQFENDGVRYYRARIVHYEHFLRQV